MEGKHDAVGTSEEEDGLYASCVDEERRRPIISGELLDIEEYAALYTGRTKIMRLLFIAVNCGVLSMEQDALRMAYEEIKKGQNTHLFREVVEKIGGELGPKYGPDDAWSDAVDSIADLRKNDLRINMIVQKNDFEPTYQHRKEGIRKAHNDYGDFYYDRGLLIEAFTSYINMRDYCATFMHLVHMCLKAILVSIEMGQFGRVLHYATHAELNHRGLDPAMIAKLHCAAGLVHLKCKHYKTAAREFLKTGPEIGNYAEVIAAEDIATYGGLCALASYDRAELKSKVIDNDNFRNFLELVPGVRELINEFYACHTATCLEYLKLLKTNLLLDIHLHDHVETLYEQIRNRALIQYTLPYVSIDLRVMANVFKTSVTGLEKELEPLIANDKIQAHID